MLHFLEKLGLNYTDLKVLSGASLSFATVPEISIPFLKDILTIGVSFTTVVYTVLRVSNEIYRIRRMRKFKKRLRDDKASNREI